MEIRCETGGRSMDYLSTTIVGNEGCSDEGCGLAGEGGEIVCFRLG